MNWIILTFISIILLSIVNIIDKYIISKELKDPIMDTFFSTLILTILFISIALIKGTIIFDSKIVTLSILAGLAHSGAILLYFSTLKKMEVSRFVPILSFTPIFVVIYASIFFNEIFSLSTYIGFFFIVLGSFIISLKNIKSIFSINKAIYIGLGVAFLFAIRNILIKSSTINNSIWSILFWIGIGTAIASILFISIHHPHIKKRAKKGIKHLILTSIIAGVAFLMLTLAFTIGPISLITVLMEIQPVLVFIIGIILTLFIPKIINEKLTKNIIIQKSISILLIIIGTIIITLKL